MASTLKLTDLQHPSSGVSAITIGSDNSVSLVGGALSPQTGFKNRIINGDMRIDQRNAGAAVNNVAGYVYSVDRWNTYGSQAAKFSSQQVASPIAGFKNAIKFTSLSAYSVGASEFFFTNQWIEGLNVCDLDWGTANAQPVTLSFKVYSSLTGTFGGVLRNDAGNRTYPFTFTISAANTAETKTITIPGDTSGTWLTTNGKGIGVFFGLGAGATYSGTAGAWGTGDVYSATGATSVVGTSGATFYVTGIQLEKGSVATPFEFRSIGQELTLCQRYYETSWITQVGTNSALVADTGFYGLNGSDAQLFFTWRVNKRASPTINVWSPLTTPAINKIRQANSGAIATVSSINVFGNIATIGNTGTSNVHFQLGWEASAEL